jgi:hypothetical protein
VISPKQLNLNNKCFDKLWDSTEPFETIIRQIDKVCQLCQCSQQALLSCGAKILSKALKTGRLINDDIKNEWDRRQPMRSKLTAVLKAHTSLQHNKRATKAIRHCKAKPDMVWLSLLKFRMSSERMFS